jgi:signal transduction histidine kinase
MELHDAKPEVALWDAVHRVPQMSFRAFRDGMETLGEEFARRAIAIGAVVTAVSSLLEISVSYIVRDYPEYALALLRMSLIGRYILVSAYWRHWEARVHSLEARLRDAEQRMLGTSAYVTGVYERERRRLSHDLHDEIGHDLVVLKLRLELIATDVGRQNFSLVLPRLNDALDLIRHAIDSVRRLVMDLGPAVFDDLGFLPAIRLYARQFTASTGIEVSVREGDMPPNLALSHQTALYRVLQGALSNVLRHSQAKHVTVAFACLKDAKLVMTVEDDGIGFDAAGVRAKQRFGLTAMRERIAVLGGKVHVQSWPTSALGGRRGTRIEVDLPLAGAGSP